MRIPEHIRRQLIPQPSSTINPFFLAEVAVAPDFPACEFGAGFWAEEECGAGEDEGAVLALLGWDCGKEWKGGLLGVWVVLLMGC